VWAGERVWGALAVDLAAGSTPGPQLARSLRRFADLIGLCLSTAQSHDELVARATVDHLTGLPNARAFHERLEGEVRLARRDGTSLSLVVIDVDHFKRVNDRHGHEVGNLVLAEVASRLTAVARAGEMVARIGGEEFAWILPDAEAAGAVVAAERARSAVAGRALHPVGRVTISAGVCALGAGTADAAELFRRADAALYAAKAQGRNRWASDVGGPALPAGARLAT
jgi:diguanylate cyclase (GGDEF)-like protein